MSYRERRRRERLRLEKIHLIQGEEEEREAEIGEDTSHTGREGGERG